MAHDDYGECRHDYPIPQDDSRIVPVWWVMLTDHSDTLLHGWPHRIMKRLPLLTWLIGLDPDALHREFCERNCAPSDELHDAA